MDTRTNAHVLVYCIRTSLQKSVESILPTPEISQGIHREDTLPGLRVPCTYVAFIRESNRIFFFSREKSCRSTTNI